jgi:hypothetical protein
LSTPAKSHRQVPSKKGIKNFSAKYWPDFQGSLKHRSFPMEKSNGQVKAKYAICLPIFIFRSRGIAFRKDNWLMFPKSYKDKVDLNACKRYSNC